MAVVICLNRFLAPVDETVTAQLQSQVTSHRTGLSWVSNDALLKDLSNTRALKHLAPLATDYWAASHSFVEPGHSAFARSLKK